MTSAINSNQKKSRKGFKTGKSGGQASSFLGGEINLNSD